MMYVRQLTGMMNRIFFILFILPFSLFSQINYFQIDTVNVGVKISPPFVMKTSNSYTGLSFDIFSSIEDSLEETHFNYIEYSSFDELCEDIKLNKIHVGVSSVSITKNRIKSLDYSLPWLKTGIGIVVNKDIDESWFDVIRGFFSIQMLKAVTSFIFIMLFFGILIWVVERKDNDNFREGFEGIWDGIYFNIVVFSTVGFGDKSTKTDAGKAIISVLILIYMIFGALLIGNFSAAFSNSYNDYIEDASQLNSLKVGTVSGTAASKFLDDNNVRYINFKDPENGVKSIINGELDAFIYDKPVLEYIISKNNISNLVSLQASVFKENYYAFPISSKFKNRIILNKCIVNTIEDEYWFHKINQYGIK
jgi:polar amino acid transport system substrate-binding protein